MLCEVKKYIEYAEIEDRGCNPYIECHTNTVVGAGGLINTRDNIVEIYYNPQPDKDTLYDKHWTLLSNGMSSMLEESNNPNEIIDAIRFLHNCGKPEEEKVK